ncbi:hypothetical protein L7F22_010621 [Adiantum nelumboides]|nr:hypothetical protein [Adiantum nelumboides]
MDILTGLQPVLKKTLAHDGLAKGLHEAAKAIEKHAAQLCHGLGDCFALLLIGAALLLEVKIAIKPPTPQEYSHDEAELLQRWGLTMLEEASRMPTDEELIKQDANSFNKRTNTAIINNRKIQIIPAIIEHIFNIPNAPVPKPCTGEQISLYLKENPEKKQKRKAGGQGIATNDLPKQKVYKFAIEAIGLKNCNTYISEKLLGMPLAREFKPEAPINLTQFLISSVASQSDKFPHMQLYKAGYIWQYLYQVIASWESSTTKAIGHYIGRRARRFILDNETVQSLNENGVLAVQTGWNTIVNGISQMMATASQAPNEYKQELEKEKQLNAQLLKDKADLEIKLTQKDQIVKPKTFNCTMLKRNSRKPNRSCKDTEFQLLHAQHAKVMLQEQNQILGRTLETRQKQLDLKEEQLTKAWKHKELIEWSIMNKYLLQTLQDISTPQGNITLKIADAQQWMSKVCTSSEDSAETFTQLT